MKARKGLYWLGVIPIGVLGIAVSVQGEVGDRPVVPADREASGGARTFVEPVDMGTREPLGSFKVVEIPPEERDAPITYIGSGSRAPSEGRQDSRLVYANYQDEYQFMRVPDPTGGPGYLAGSNMWLADDMVLAMNWGFVTKYWYMTYSYTGTAPYTVHSALFRFDACTSTCTSLVDWHTGDCCETLGATPVPIAGTVDTTTIPSDGFVWVEITVDPPVWVEQDVFMYLEYTGPNVADNAGWPIAGDNTDPGDIGFTDDFWVEDVGGVGCGLFWFHPDPAYAGFAASVEAMSNELLADDGAEGNHFGGSAAIDGDVAVIGAALDDNQNGDSAGGVYVFRLSGSTWGQVAKLLASDGHPNQQFGCSVDICGNTVLVGVPLSNAAYVFVEPEGGWDSVPSPISQSAKLIPSDGVPWDNFGASVACIGDHVLIGAPGRDDQGYGSGAAYHFQKPPSGWHATMTETSPKLLPNDPDGEYVDDWFGESVDICADGTSGYAAIIGATGDDETAFNAGAAFTFWYVSQWVQDAKLRASVDGEAVDWFGNSVAIRCPEECYAVVGAAHDDDNGEDSGSAYWWRGRPDLWSAQPKLLPPDGAPGDYFGASVAISTTADVVIGAPQGDTGSAYLFALSPIEQPEKLVPPDGAEGDRFGFAVAISGDTIVIGASKHGHEWPATGSAYVFCAAECCGDDECDDCLYCNGEDTCVGGTCQAAGDPCTPATVCDEDTDTCEPDFDSDGIPDDEDNCPDVYNPYQADSDFDLLLVANSSFESPAGVETIPDDFVHFTKCCRDSGCPEECDNTCAGANQIAHIATDHSFDGDQAVYLYAYSGNPASTPLACHRESGVQTLATYDLTGRFKLSVWVTDFTHSSALACEYVSTRFRLDDGVNHTYISVFNYGQYVQIPPGYDDYVEMATGADGRTWRRFEVDIPELWRKPAVTVTLLTVARSWCAGWTVHSGLYADDIEVIYKADSVGDACDNCDLYNPDQADCQPNLEGDVCDIAYATSDDCQQNDVPDECDIRDGTSQDCQPNGIPDECEVPPIDPAAPDCQPNDVPDECESADWKGPDGGSYTYANNWECHANGDPIVPTADALLSNTEAPANTATLDDPNPQELCNLTVSATLAEPQTLEIASGAHLTVSGKATIDAGGRLNVIGGTVTTESIEIKAEQLPAPTGELTNWDDIYVSLDWDHYGAGWGNCNWDEIHVGRDLWNHAGAEFYNMDEVSVNGNFINNGDWYGNSPIISRGPSRNGSKLMVFGDCEIAPGAGFEVGDGIVQVGGDWSCAIDAPDRFDLTEGTLQFIGMPGNPQNVEVMAADNGEFVDPADPIRFRIGELHVGPFPSTVALVDNYDNSGREGNEALYVGNLILDNSVTVDLDGKNVYYEDLTIGDDVTIIPGGALIPVDCNGNAVPDDQDRDDCDGSPWCNDCNGNITLDECDIDYGESNDCQPNGVPDECDIAEGTSSDDNGNGIPDECEIRRPMAEDCATIAPGDRCNASGTCTADSDCADESHCVLPPAGETGDGVCHAPKARYLSITRHPWQAGSTARRVKLDTDELVGWVGEPYYVEPTSQHDGLWLADLVGVPHYETQWPDVVHVTGCGIAHAALCNISSVHCQPNSCPGGESCVQHSYHIQAILLGQDIADEGAYSEVLELHTASTWGDTVSTCEGNVCRPPDGHPGLDDIMAAISYFMGDKDVAPLVWLDIDPSNGTFIPDQIVGLGDIMGCIAGFQGAAYPGDGPLGCP